MRERASIAVVERLGPVAQVPLDNHRQLNRLYLECKSHLYSHGFVSSKTEGSFYQSLKPAGHPEQV